MLSQGLGNQFLSHIRETDAICQVVRVFTDPDVSHVDGDVSPERDIETIATELMLADLQTLEKAAPRLAKEAKSAKDPDKTRIAAAAEMAQQVLDGGTTLFTGAAAAGIDLADLRELQLLTARPFLYVFNEDDAEIADDDLRKRLTALVAPVSSRPSFSTPNRRRSWPSSSRPKRLSCSPRWASASRDSRSWRGPDSPRSGCRPS